MCLPASIQQCAGSAPPSTSSAGCTTVLRFHCCCSFYILFPSSFKDQPLGTAKHWLPPAGLHADTGCGGVTTEPPHYTARSMESSPLQVPQHSTALASRLQVFKASGHLRSHAFLLTGLWNSCFCRPFLCICIPVVLEEDLLILPGHN